MSTTIDQRVVEMQFDNKQFETNVKTSLSTLDKLKQSLNLNGASKGLENVSSAAKKCDMSGLSGAVQTVQAKFSTLEVMAVTALANITNTAVNAGKRIVSALTIDPIKLGFQEYETQINAVQTILANTSSKGTNLDQVNNALDELNTYADKTIYNFTEMTRNIGTFTAAGVDLDTSVSAIKGIANLAAVSGSTSQQASTAMYQLSQALASGTVKLMDWNSVVNAGMGGQVFQDALKETARVHGVAIDSMVKDEGSFRETLSKGWLTSDILTETLAKFTGDLNKDQLRTMGYTNKQIQSIMKMGQTANDAATKVKTFTQLFDTLKEAAQSGWTKSWEIIIGDFGEAKELLTEMSDTFGEMLNESANARNEVLLGGLASGWKQLLKQGIADSAGYEDVIKKVAKSHGVVLDDMINDNVSFQDALSETLKDGRLTSETLTEALSTLTSKTAGLSDEQLKERGYTRAQIDSLESLNESVQNGTISMDEFAKKMMRTSGRENLIEALRNSLNGVLSIIKPVTEAFKEIFPPMTGEQLYKITENIKKLTASFKLSETTSANLKSTFKGLFAVLDIVKQGIGFVINVAGELFGLFGGPAAGGILGVTASIGDLLVKLNQAVKEGNIFKRAFETLKEVFTTVAEKITDAITRIKEAFGGFKSVDTGPIDEFSSTAEKSFSPFTRIAHIFGAAFEAIVKVLEWATPIVAKLGSIIGKGLGTLADKVSYAVENMDFNEILDLINTGLFGAILLGIKKFIGSLTDITSNAGGFIKGLTGILDGVRGSLEAYQSRLKAKNLLTIASAIGILAASLFVLSMIDSGKLTTALIGITVLFIELSAAMIVLRKALGTGKMAKVSGTMIAMSAAILILSFAMKNLASLDWEGVAKGTVGIAALAAVLVIAANSLGKSSVKLIKGSTGLIAFSAAILILTHAVDNLAQLSWEELAKGLVGLTVILTEVVALTHLMGDPKRMISTGVGMIALGAAMLIFASAVEKMGQLSWGEISRGLIAMAGALTTITVAMNLMPKGMINKATGMVIMGAALQIIANAMAKFGDMQWSEIARGLVSMAGALAAITIALNLMPKGMINKVIGLIGVATALQIMIGPLKQMAGMSWGEVAKGLITLGGSLLIITVAINAMTGGLAGAAAMLVMAAAIRVLTPALVSLGQMDLAKIGKALLALVGVFVVVGAAGLVLAPLIPLLKQLAGAIALLGVAVLAIGGGLLMFSAGLTALAVSGTAGAAALVFVVTSLLSLIPMALEKLGEGVVAFAKVISNGMPAIMEAVKQIALGLIQVLVEITPPVVEALLTFLITLLEQLADAVPKMIDAGMRLLLGILEGISEHIMDVVVVALNIISEFLRGIAEGIPGIITAGIDIVVAFLTAIGQETPRIIDAGFKMIIDFINGLADAIRENTPVLGTAMGNLAGAMIDGLVGGITAGVKSVVDSVKNLGKNALNGLKNFLGIHSPSKEFENLGMYTSEGFAKGVKGDQGNITTTVSDMSAKMLAVLNSSSPKFQQAGNTLMINFIAGVRSKDAAVNNTFVQIVSGALTAIKNKYTVFYNAGGYLVDGFADGITANTYKATAKSKAMAQAALDAAKKVLNIHSPSKEFFKVGNFAGMGFVNALDDYSSKSYDAGYDMADSARNGLGKAIAKIRDVITGDIDSSPTIKPVMDLSNIQNGANQLYRMMDGVNGYAVSGSVNMANQTANRMNRRTSNNNDDPTSSAINGLNKVVKELASNPAKTFENTFNISGNNPKEIAEEVSRIIQRQVERRDASWA